MSACEQRHKVRDLSVRLLRGGKGTPLVYLHGAAGLPGWLPFFERLSESFDVLVPEHPGFGTSDNPAWMRNIADMAMYYLDFLDGLGSERVHLVGHSLGGWIAAEVAVRNTTRLATARGSDRREATRLQMSASDTRGGGGSPRQDARSTTSARSTATLTGAG